MAEILFSALSARQGGGLTYIRNIVRAFPQHPGSRLTILSPAPLEGLPAHPNVAWEQAPAWTRRPIPRVLFGSIYFRYLWPRRRDFDAVYYAGGSFDIALPKGVKRIVAFRNMLPFDREARRRYPLGWSRLRHWLLEFVQTSAIRKADLVVFISRYARNVIDQRVGQCRGASVVIPHGASLTGTPLNADIADHLPERFVLYLSTLDYYKAQVELVEAWAEVHRLRPTPEKLVLAGPESVHYGDRVRETIRRLGLDEQVILSGPIPHDQVSDIARRATLNVFLSSCENCPNILLELMLVGRPMLVSDRQPMPELGGPGLDYVDPYDPPAIAAAIARLLDDPERMSRNTEAARSQAPLYSWAHTGQATWSAILGLGN